jgi:hypothetical protein
MPGLWLDYYIGIAPTAPGTWECILRTALLFFAVRAECLKVVPSFVPNLFSPNSDIVRPCILSIRRRTTSILIPNNLILRSHLSSHTATTILAVLLIHRLTFNSLLAIMITTNRMVVPSLPTSSAARSNFPPANLPGRPFVWNCRRYKRLIWAESQYDHLSWALVFAFY